MSNVPVDLDIKVLEYDSTESAEAGTTTTNIKITEHGLETGDFIVNTTRRGTSQNSAERGSRKVTKVDADNLTVSPAITGQTTGDSIMLFKFVDRTSYIKQKSFQMTRRVEGNNSVTFKLLSPTTDIYRIKEGQIIKVFFDSTIQATFVCTESSWELVSDTTNTWNRLECSIEGSGLNSIPGRRTIKVDYDEGDLTSTIASTMVSSYLYQEGIEAGTIDTGVALGEDWVDDSISVSDVLDFIAEKNGFQWFIDKNMALQFYQDPGSISNAPRNILDGGAAYYSGKIKVRSCIDQFINKIFSVGGNDDFGNQIFAVRGDMASQNAMQAITAGSGVYGFVSRNGSNVEFVEDETEAGTTTTNITATGIGDALVVDDFIWNYTRSSYTYVSAVINSNNITVETVTGQTTGDTIYYYPSANKQSQNILKKQSVLPSTLTFKTYYTDFEPGTKINIEIAKLDISNSYWNIESVRFQDIKTDGNGTKLECFVTCVLRDNSNFSTQKKLDSNEFFKQF